MVDGRIFLSGEASMLEFRLTANAARGMLGADDAQHRPPPSPPSPRGWGSAWRRGRRGWHHVPGHGCAQLAELEADLAHDEGARDALASEPPFHHRWGLRSVLECVGCDAESCIDIGAPSRRVEKWAELLILLHERPYLRTTLVVPEDVEQAALEVLRRASLRDAADDTDDRRSKLRQLKLKRVVRWSME